MLLCWRNLLIFFGALGVAHSAHAHGIAGNRYFPGTLTFDDPAVADDVRSWITATSLFAVASEENRFEFGSSSGSRLAPTWAKLAKRQ